MAEGFVSLGHGAALKEGGEGEAYEEQHQDDQKGNALED